MTLRRIGLIVPSSNTTMEREVPKLVRKLGPPDVEYSFHGARVPMKHVVKEELVAMNARAMTAMRDLMDAPMDAVAYACLVAIMAMGKGHHRAAAEELQAVARETGRHTAALTSAGALVRQLRENGVKKVALVMPYADALARTVAEYIEAEGMQVLDYVNLSVTDNAEVGCITGERVLDAARRLKLKGADHLVLSCCVQMPSADILEKAEILTGVPVTSAALCTAKEILRELEAA
ncbi:MAG: Asp/Glu racemase [Alphaproteobacteria bacterium]|nr:Asp/Glu racemase [Alphaproteobacteria bacterium]MBL7097287.1 Asp/Glu racemase [Alphaproteobacteria bacterium]